jgi:hypothetical protein
MVIGSLLAVFLRGPALDSRYRKRVWLMRRKRLLY